MPSLQDLVNVKFRDSFIYLCNWLSDVCSDIIVIHLLTVYTNYLNILYSVLTNIFHFASRKAIKIYIINDTLNSKMKTNYQTCF